MIALRKLKRVTATNSMFAFFENRLNRTVACQTYQRDRLERVFESLKYAWIFKVAQPTRVHMKQDVANIVSTPVMRAA